MRLLYLIIALIVACGSASASAPMQLRHAMVPHAYTSEDGLPQAGVTDILQTSDGYLWIATFGGLARFDGQAFTAFRNGGGSMGGPSSDVILALAEDDRGRLWIGTHAGGVSVYEHGVFRDLPICDGTCSVSGILQAAGGAIWLATSAGVFTLAPDGQHASMNHPPTGGGYDSLMVEGGDGRIYLGGREGLRILGGAQPRVMALPDDARHVVVLERHGDDLLVGTERGLYRYRPAGDAWDPLGIDRPERAARDAEGRWWVVDGDWNVMHEDGTGGWRHVPELSGLAASALASDDEGNLWIGSSTKGLLRVRASQFGLLAAPTLAKGAAGRAVIGDGHGGLWLAVACGDLLHVGQDGSTRTVPVKQVLGNDCVYNLMLDRGGVLWVGSVSGALARMTEDGRIAKVGEWPGVQAINVTQDRDGDYFANLQRATYRWQVGADGRPGQRRRLEALDGMAINSVVPSLRGGNWFIGDQGVLRIVGDEVIEQWTPAEGLSSRFARAVYEDEADGSLWIGTYGGGLHRVRDGEVRHYGSGNGLVEDVVSCIVADDRGRLWLGGNLGITMLTAPAEAGASIESVAYAAGDGLVPFEVNGGASSPCHRDTRGRIWFSMIEGFAVIDPARIGDVQPAVLRPYIDRVAVAGEAKAVGPSSTLILPSYSRNLEIGYVAINLGRPRDTRFRFRLSGFDRDWVDAGQNRSILYPTIPWGTHQFEVEARSAGGPWSPVPARLEIVHPQPWYLRPWIWTLATSMGLVVLLGSTRLERRQGRATPLA